MRRNISEMVLALEAALTLGKIGRKLNVDWSGKLTNWQKAVEEGRYEIWKSDQYYERFFRMEGSVRYEGLSAYIAPVFGNPAARKILIELKGKPLGEMVLVGEALDGKGNNIFTEPEVEDEWSETLGMDFASHQDKESIGKSEAGNLLQQWIWEWLVTVGYDVQNLESMGNDCMVWSSAE